MFDPITATKAQFEDYLLQTHRLLDNLFDSGVELQAIIHNTRGPDLSEEKAELAELEAEFNAIEPAFLQAFALFQLKFA